MCASGPPQAALRRLRQQYYALTPSYILSLPDSSDLASPESQSFLVERILEDKAFSHVQPEAGYRKSFWRKVLSVLEEGVRELQKSDSEAEVDERIYETVADLMAVPTAGPSNPAQSYRTFLYDEPDCHQPDGQAHNGEERHVTLLEEQIVLQAGTTGLRTWTAALHLAHHILHDADKLDIDFSQPILELGAGTGFLSILLARLGATVFATDLDSEPDDIEDGGPDQRETPLRRLRENARLNGSLETLRVQPLDWFDAQKPTGSAARAQIDKFAPDTATIVAADVIYDPDLVPPLVETIRAVLLPEEHSDLSRSWTKQAIIAATERNPSTLDLFVQTCASRDLLVETILLDPVSREEATFCDSGLDRSTPVRIMRVAPRPPLRWYLVPPEQTQDPSRHAD